MRATILTQCCGTLGLLAFSNGLLLLYLDKLGFSGVAVMACLALPATLRFLLVIPGAYWADRHGKKRLGLIGIAMTVVGYGALGFGSWMEDLWLWVVVLAGVIVFSAGYAFFTSGWYALLDPIGPGDERGCFFGRLRLSWQLVAVFFAGFCMVYLKQDSPLRLFQYVLGVLVAGQALRLVFYLRIPELEKSCDRGEGFWAALFAAVRASGYMSFCSYIFLLGLATVGCQALFGLIEKRVLELGDTDVVWLGNLGMIGAMAGFYLGGKAIDRWSTKPIFLAGHFGYGAILFLFLLRGSLPSTVWVTYLGVLHFAYGVASAAISVGVSTEMLALVPAENKSLSTSVCTTLQAGGGALSGLLIAAVLKLGVLTPTWTLWGLTLSDYDSVLLFCSVAILLLVVTLGLVPSVIGKAQWVPRSD